MPNSLMWWIADFELLLLIWVLGVQAYRRTQPGQQAAVARRVPVYDRSLFQVQALEKALATSAQCRERGER